MNKDMIFGVIRHVITVISGGLLMNNTETLDGLFTGLITNITNGEISTIAGTVFTIFAVLWSIWVKVTEEKQNKVLKALHLK